MHAVANGKLKIKKLLEGIIQKVLSSGEDRGPYYLSTDNHYFIS